MEALRRLHQSKSIRCPSCKHIFIIDEKKIQISGDTNIISILHKVCREANPKKLHVCTQCGSRSNYSRNKLIKYYCKCTNKDNETPSANSAHSTETYLAKVIDILSSSENEMGIDTDSIAAAIVSSNESPSFRKESLEAALASGVENGSIIETNGLYSVNGKPKGPEGTPDAAVFEASADGDSSWNPEDIPEHHHNMESPNPNCEVHDVQLFFSDRSEWPENSAKYFLREHNNPGDGRRGLVFNCLLDKNRTTGFSGLSDEEMYYHLHAASVHRGITQEQSKDVCRLSAHMEKQCQQEMKCALEATNNAYTEALKDALGKLVDVTQAKQMMEQIDQSVQESMKAHYAIADSAQKIGHPTDPNNIRRKYTRENNSIMKSLPIPVVGIKHGCAHIPAKQIVNHFLALERDVKWYRAGQEDDWKCNNGTYECSFTAEVHKKLMNEDPKCIPKDTRVCFGRVWSDAFEAHHIVAKNGFSSLQLFTLSLLNSNHRITKRNTWPCALCFKKANNAEIFIHILEEIHSLQKPALRYWGKDKQVVPTIVYLQMVCQDYPERCYCTSMADLGKYTHRWGHSSLYDNEVTPSCPQCEWKHVMHVNNHNDNPIGDCSNLESKCQDWWNTGRKDVHGREQVYPISPEDAVKQSKSGKTIDENQLIVPSVELSFELWEKSIKELEDWVKNNRVRENSIHKNSIPKIARTYLRMIGLAPAVAKGLAEVIAREGNASESEWYMRMSEVIGIGI